MIPGSMPMRGPGGARGGMRGPMGRGDYGEFLTCLALITHYIITNATVTRATTDQSHIITVDDQSSFKINSKLETFIFIRNYYSVK